MSFGLTGNINQYYLGSLYQQNKTTEKSSSVSFQNTISAKAAEKVTEQADVTGMSFKDMWQARFPGAYYHVMDASKIPMGVWCRNDFPVEKFFQDDVDESVLGWEPTGTEPDMADASVQNRLNSVLGQYVINVPPELEEKMKNDPSIAKKIMKNIDELFAWNGHPVPGRINGGVICLDENGEVARWNLISGGGRITQSSGEMVEAYYRRREKQAEYEQIAEENAIKRKLQEQETDKRYYQSKTAKRVQEANARQGEIYDKSNFLSEMQSTLEDCLKNGLMDTYMRYIKEVGIYAAMTGRNA